MKGSLSQFSKNLQSRLTGFFDSPPGADATPIEIGQAVLDDVETRVAPVGRGRRVFPFNRILVRVIREAADRPAIEAALVGLTDRVRERLRELQCDGPPTLEVSVAVLDQAPGEWEHGRTLLIEYASAPEDESPSAPDRTRREALQIRIVTGAATQPVYTFTGHLIAIGRTMEATDGRGQVRRNRVAFLDAEDGITETVGRAHARLQIDQATGAYHLFDEGSSNGTAIIRDGVTIRVAPRDPRGVRVQPGDEIQLGRAVIQVEPPPGG